jgi:hypothetical protein
MQKTIRIPQTVTANLFEVRDIDYFNKHIRGRVLPVLNETKAFITVADSNDEEYTVNKGDLQGEGVTV